MTTKLNLTIEQETARQIKQYAEKRNTSVSKIADDYFKELVKNKTKAKSFVEKYGGIINSNSKMDFEKEKDEYLKEKYGY